MCVHQGHHPSPLLVKWLKKQTPCPFQKCQNKKSTLRNWGEKKSSYFAEVFRIQDFNKSSTEEMKRMAKMAQPLIQNIRMVNKIGQKEGELLWWVMHCGYFPKTVFSHLYPNDHLYSTPLPYLNDLKYASPIRNGHHNRWVLIPISILWDELELIIMHCYSLLSFSFFFLFSSNFTNHQWMKHEGLPHPSLPLTKS